MREARGLPIHQPAHLKTPENLEPVRLAAPQALVVAAYGLILPQALLDMAPHGALNIHASLLPRWRGAAPIQRALLAGDTRSGISIMQMDAGLDTGPIIAQRAVDLAPDEDAGTLHDKLASLGAEMIVAALEDIAAGRARAQPQSHPGVTYAPKVGKQEAALDWGRPAVELERAVRAFHPALTVIEGESLRIWRARVVPGNAAAGTVIEAGARLVAACGEQALEILELQRAGGRRLPAAQYLRGRPIQPGTRLG